jgi:tetratricopeptide (TPR) repeat protein
MVTDPDAAITAYREALDALRTGDSAGAAAATLHVLLALDAVAQATSGITSSELLSELASLDGQLQAAAPIITGAVGADTLLRWRASAGPPSSSWWWSLDEIAAANEPKPWLGWAILAGFFITLSISFIAEISARFLAGQPDFFGVFSTLTQALLALLAGGALTRAGSQWIDGLLAGRGIARPAHAYWKTALALLVLGIVVALRLSLPAFARTYSDRGVRQQEAGRVTSAIYSYQRAISLAPDYALAHYNLGSAYEDILQYDKAVVEYQTAIQNDPQIYLAYNNLARLYMLQKHDYVSALRLLERGVDLKPGEAAVEYSLRKNEAWAYLALKLPGLAEADLRKALDLRPEGAAAHCLMAQTLELRGRMTDALPFWEHCVAYYGPQENVEPDWYATARERMNASGNR